MSRLLALYPRPWRDRYEIEFRTLIEERPPSLVERLDIVRGAVDAHLHPQLGRKEAPTAEARRSDADLRVVRRLGLGAIVGAAVWVAAFAVASVGPIRYDGDGAYRDGGAAAPLLILATGLLAAGLVGQLVWLPQAARLARIGAGGAIPFVLIWGLAPWLWWFGLLALMGLLALAVGGQRSGAWSVSPSFAVVGACIAVVTVGLFGAATIDGDRLAGAELFGYIGIACVPAWLGIGAPLIRPPG
jgi:hypothetical protein